MATRSFHLLRSKPLGFMPDSFLSPHFNPSGNLGDLLKYTQNFATSHHHYYCHSGISHSNLLPRMICKKLLVGIAAFIFATMTYSQHNSQNDVFKT